jgi:hypothetical protein
MQPDRWLWVFRTKTLRPSSGPVVTNQTTRSHNPEPKIRVTTTVNTHMSWSYCCNDTIAHYYEAWVLAVICVLKNSFAVPTDRAVKGVGLDRSPAEIVGSNPTGAWMSVCCEWCVLYKYRSLQRADHSSRGVLTTVVRRCVWSRNLVNEEAWPTGGCRAKNKTKTLSQCRFQIGYLHSD